MSRRSIHNSISHVNHKSRWMQVTNDNNNGKGEMKFNGDLSDDSDLFGPKYETSLYNQIVNQLLAVWSYITFAHVGNNKKTTPKRFTGSAAEGLGISLYTLPVYWLYRLCMWIQLYDVWLLSKLHAPQRLHTKPTQNRVTSLALFLLFMPFIVLAGYIFYLVWTSPSWQIAEFLFSPVYTVLNIIHYFANILLNLVTMLVNNFTFFPSLLSSGIATVSNFSAKLLPDGIPMTDAELTEYQDVLRETSKANILNEILQSEKLSTFIDAVLTHNNSNDDIKLFIQQAVSKNSQRNEILEIKEEFDQKITVMEEKLDSAYTKLDKLLQQLTDFEKAIAAQIGVSLEGIMTQQRMNEKLSTYENKIQQKSDEEYKKIYGKVVSEVVDLIKMEIKERYSELQSVQRNLLPAQMNVSEWESIKYYVNTTVEKLLAVYDADKTNTVDYAMGSSGGSVVSTRCTEPYTEAYASYQLFGFLNWQSQPVSPAIVIQPGIQPGLCWAFVGSRGNLVFELSQNITVTGFTMEHIPSSISTSGNIDSAPYVFHVLGLESENDENSTFLGRFTYEDNGVSLQRYDAQLVRRSFKMVELVIESNHGNAKYTCLYRFRVHGIPTH